jgi:hypothetical protein
MALLCLRFWDDFSEGLIGVYCSLGSGQISNMNHGSFYSDDYHGVDDT